LDEKRKEEGTGKSMKKEYTEKTSVLIDVRKIERQSKWIEIVDETTIEGFYKAIQDIVGTNNDDIIDSQKGWCIGDYENIPLQTDASLETILEVARIVRGSGYQIAKAFVEYVGIDCFGELDEALDFEYCLIGIYKSVEDYARELVNKSYNLDRTAGDLTNFNYVQFAYDIESQLIDTFPIDAGVVIFTHKALVS
jgi:antirestriction protein